MTGLDEEGAVEAVARVGEQIVLEFPKDLYIPPDALAVILEAFEGPLDLLLYLIRKQNIDILDIPIAEVTRQYMRYIDLMQDMQLELAAEYLVMAAWLAEIKSRMLLPRPAPESAGDEGDPRLTLVRRLQEYEQLRQAAERLDALPLVARDVFPASVQLPPIERKPEPPHVSMDELLDALRAALQRAALIEHHHVQREAISVRERMSLILLRVAEGTVLLLDLLVPEEGRRGVVVSFLAMLELLKAGQIEVERDMDGLFTVSVRGACDA
ncbi:MAG: segregation/condensation protein A [Halothiobacillaceae bacterium]|nr:MAG: segregation/condensation protein A [Halothiobacillaceae bacterium]